MGNLLAQAHTIFTAIQNAWPLIVVLLPPILSIISTITTKTSNYPAVSTWLHKVATLLSWAEHADVAGWKWPFTLTSRPVVGQPLPKPESPLKIGVLLALCLVGGHARAQEVTWTAPTFSAGVDVALAEVSVKTGAVGVGSGLALTLEFGQATFLGRSWSLLDVSVDVLGGLVLPGGSPAGALQLGGCLGTLNSFVKGCLLSTPYASDGAGWGQGGAPGLTLAAMANVTAIWGALFPSTTVAAPKGFYAEQELPRGGL